MKVALYKNTQFGFTSPWDLPGDDGEPQLSGWVRVSEWVEVEFPPRPAEEIVPAQLEALSQEEKVLRTQFTEKLNEIATRRANLLALTHEPETA